MKKIILWILFFLLLAGGTIAYIGYRIIYFPNVSIGEKKSVIIYIPTESKYEDVIRILAEKKIFKNEKSFELLGKIKKYKDKIKPGRYRVLANMSNNNLINILKAGLQEPITLTFNNIRTKEHLIFRVCHKLEADSAQLTTLLNDNRYLKENFGMNSETILTLFIPNTYKFYWNTSAKKFIAETEKEYKIFWNEERKAKAKKIGLTQEQISILASIVQEEQLRFLDENQIIAGIFLNRLKTGMPLQSDPTLKFALKDFSIQRLLNKDKEVDSPYNTYRHNGLPPGPITIPKISSVDAVLNFQQTDFFYMCAKEDFSGRHNFAKTLDEHNRNVKKYHKALDENKIVR